MKYLPLKYLLFLSVLLVYHLFFVDVVIGAEQKDCTTGYINNPNEYANGAQASCTITGYRSISCQDTCNAGSNGNPCLYEVGNSCPGGGNQWNGTKSALNGAIVAGDTGKRWVKDSLSCNQSYLGVSVRAYNVQRYDLGEGAFNCDYECGPGQDDCQNTSVDGKGHFNMYDVVYPNEDMYVVLTIPATVAYKCENVTWSITDRHDLYNSSDDTNAGTGTGCEASFRPASDPFDWRYGVVFTMNPVTVDTTVPTCNVPTFSPSNIVSGTSIIATATATDQSGIAKTGIYIYQGNTAIKEIQSNNTANTNTSVTTTWDLKDTAGNLVPTGDYQMHFNWYDTAGNFSQCQGNFKVDKTPPTCQTPVITPSGNITTSFSATGTATDNNGIKKTGIYIYKKSPNTHVREIQSNNTLNTTGSVTKTWDLKDDAGNVVPDGNYEIHYNWYDEGGLMTQCKASFAKGTITPTASYSCSTGVTPSTFTFVPSQSKPLSIILNASVVSTVNVKWSDSCALGTFDLSGASNLSKTYSLVSADNTLSVDWKAKAGNPVIASGCNIQANIQSVNPSPTLNVLPSCSVASVTAGTQNRVAWAGKAIWSDLDCPTLPSSSEWGTSPILSDATVNIARINSTTDLGGNFTIEKAFYGGSITETIYATKPDYDFICYKNGSTVRVKTGGNWNRETFLPGNYNITPYFKFAPPSFITANNGEVYSGNEIILNKPSVTNPQYFQTSSSDKLGGLVLSKGSITSAWDNKTTQNYSKTGLENYSLDLALYLDKLIIELDKNSYDLTLQDIVYKNTDLNISAEDLINDYENKILIVKGSVVITDSDNFGNDKIKTYIMATEDITFKSTVNKPENTLKMLGGVFAKGVIDLQNREKSAINDGFKDPTIEFNLDASLFNRDKLDAVKVADVSWREIL